MDELPFREKIFLGCRRYSRSENTWRAQNYKEIHKVLKLFKGKPVDEAYSEFCRRIPKQKRYPYYFWREFNPPRYWHSASGPYYLEEGRIYVVKQVRNKRITITSPDYVTELRHKETGHPISKFKTLAQMIPPSYWTYRNRRLVELSTETERRLYEKSKSSKTLYYGLHFSIKLQTFVRTESECYTAKPEDFVLKIVSGWCKTFSSKNDPFFKRHHAELKKRKKSKPKTMSEETFRQILNAKRTKEKEETKLKLEAKGFRPNAFTSNTTDSH